jgi:hypothetical protein
MPDRHPPWVCIHILKQEIQSHYHIQVERYSREEDQYVLTHSVEGKACPQCLCELI